MSSGTSGLASSIRGATGKYSIIFILIDVPQKDEKERNGVPIDHPSNTHPFILPTFLPILLFS